MGRINPADITGIHFLLKDAPLPRKPGISYEGGSEWLIPVKSYTVLFAVVIES